MRWLYWTAATLAGGYVTAYTIRSTTVDLEWFSPAEFGASWPLVATVQLEHLDRFRAFIGAPLEVSPAPGAVARTLAPSDESLHNVTRYGQSYATDVLIPPGWTLKEAYEAARRSGLWGGVGVYPDWQPRAGLHLDTRHLAGDKAPPGRPQDLAKWAGLPDGQGGQQYVAVERAFA